jgi:hypothetical protein
MATTCTKLSAVMDQTDYKDSVKNKAGLRAQKKKGKHLIRGNLI